MYRCDITDRKSRIGLCPTVPRDSLQLFVLKRVGLTTTHAWHIPNRRCCVLLSEKQSIQQSKHRKFVHSLCVWCHPPTALAFRYVILVGKHFSCRRPDRGLVFYADMCRTAPCHRPATPASPLSPGPYFCKRGSSSFCHQVSVLIESSEVELIKGQSNG